MPFHSLDASAVVHSRSPSRSPPDSSRLPFPHRSAPQSSARAPCGGLTPPPAGRRRRATKPSSCVQQASVIASYRGRLLSAHTAQNAGSLSERGRPAGDRKLPLKTLPRSCARPGDGEGGALARERRGRPGRRWWLPAGFGATGATSYRFRSVLRPLCRLCLFATRRN